MIHISQRDNKWGWKKIGNSNSLIRDYGCTITALAMGADYFGDYQNPGWMAKNLKFLVDKIIWQSINKVLDFHFKFRYYKNETKIFGNAINKNPKQVVLLEIKRRHWVIGTKRLIGGYMVVDPWDAKSKFMFDSVVTGGTILEK